MVESVIGSFNYETNIGIILKYYKVIFKLLMRKTECVYKIIVNEGKADGLTLF